MVACVIKYRPLLPLLVCHLLLIGALATPELEGDALRYVTYGAEQWLRTGEFADPTAVNIRNGPGYPLWLMPWVAMGMSPWGLKLLNAGLLFGAMAFFYALLRGQVSRRWALGMTYALGLYPPLLAEAIHIAYEPLLLCLMTGFLYHLNRALATTPSVGQSLLAAGYLAGAAYTKPNIAYVVVALALGAVLWGIARRQARDWRPAGIFLLAGLCFLPYLHYTYQLTGKRFFWGNQGGELLYWKTSAYPGEQGSWHQVAMVAELSDDPAQLTPEERLLAKRHRAFMREMVALPPLARDSALRTQAIRQLKAHPEAFVQHSMASLLRLFFNYPFSYQHQKLSTYFHLLPNIVLVVFCALAAWVWLHAYRHMPRSLAIALAWTLLYLGSITLLNGRVRHLIPALPMLFWAMAFAFDQLVLLRLLPTPNKPLIPLCPPPQPPQNPSSDDKSPTSSSSAFAATSP
jgi:hypothetical protein